MMEYTSYDSDAATHVNSLKSKLITIDKIIHTIKDKTISKADNTPTYGYNSKNDNHSVSVPFPTSTLGKVKKHHTRNLKGLSSSQPIATGYSSSLAAFSSSLIDCSYIIDSQSAQKNICQSCGSEFALSGLKWHEANECCERPTRCPEMGCEVVIPLSMVKKHISKECLIARRRRNLLKTAQIRKQISSNIASRIVPADDVSDVDDTVKNAAMLLDESQQPKIEDEVEENQSINFQPSATPTVHCSQCSQEMRKSQHPYHLRFHCINRKIYCINKRLGCNKEVCFSDIQQHLLTECEVEKHKEQLIMNAKARLELVQCSGCGDSIQLMYLMKHESKECSNKRVQCRNHSIGCNVMVRLNERQSHEHVDGKKAFRSCLYFDGDGSYINLNEADIPAPWTVEFWLYRPSSLEAVKTYIKNIARNIVQYTTDFNKERDLKSMSMKLVLQLKDKTLMTSAVDRKVVVDALAVIIRDYESACLQSCQSSQTLLIALNGANIAIAEAIASINRSSAVVTDDQANEASSTISIDTPISIVADPPGHQRLVQYLVAERKRVGATRGKSRSDAVKDKLEMEDSAADAENANAGISSAAAAGDLPSNNNTVVDSADDDVVDTDNIPAASADTVTATKTPEVIIDVCDSKLFDVSTGILDQYHQYIVSVSTDTFIGHQDAFVHEPLLYFYILYRLLSSNTSEAKKHISMLRLPLHSWKRSISAVVDCLAHDNDVLRLWREDAGLLQPTKLSSSSGNSSNDTGNASSASSKMLKKEEEKRRRDEKKAKDKADMKLAKLKADGDTNSGSDQQPQQTTAKLSTRIQDLMRGNVGCDVLLSSALMCSMGNSSKICLDMNGCVGIVTYQSKATGGSAAHQFKASIPRERWVHLAITCTKEPREVVNLYVDGLFSESVKDISFPLPMRSLGAGLVREVPFTGALLDIRYWRKLRSTIEINQGRHKLIDMDDHYNSNIKEMGNSSKSTTEHMPESAVADNNSTDSATRTVNATNSFDFTSEGLLLWYPLEEKLYSTRVYDATEYRFKTPILAGPYSEVFAGYRWLYADFIPQIKTGHATVSTAVKDDLYVLPIPSFKMRLLCPFEIKRFRLSEAGRALQREVDCPLGCEERMKTFNIRLHTTYICQRRQMSCRFDGCKSTFPMYQKQEHEEKYCRYILNRAIVLNESAKQNVPVLCQLCSKEVKMRHLGRHMADDCLHRLINCPHDDCNIELQAHRLNEHCRYECCSINIKRKVMLINRSRTNKPYARPWAWGVEVNAAMDESVEVEDSESDK